VVCLLFLVSVIASHSLPSSEGWSAFDSSIFTSQVAAERLRVLKTLILIVFVLLIAVSLVWLSITLGWIRGKNAFSKKSESTSFIQENPSVDAETSKAINEALRKYGSQRGSTWRSSTNWQ